MFSAVKRYQGKLEKELVNSNKLSSFFNKFVNRNLVLLSMYIGPLKCHDG